MAVTEDDLRLANELAHRAIEDALSALTRTRGGGLTMAQIQQLGEVVEQARRLVAEAQKLTASAQAVQVHAREQRRALRAVRRTVVQRAERVKHNFLAMVTWGRRGARCGACGQKVLVAYRCSSQMPCALCELPCPAPGCGAQVSCMLPESAFDFQVRALAGTAKEDES